MAELKIKVVMDDSEFKQKTSQIDAIIRAYEQKTVRVKIDVAMTGNLNGVTKEVVQLAQAQAKVAAAQARATAATQARMAAEARLQTQLARNSTIEQQVIIQRSREAQVANRAAAEIAKTGRASASAADAVQQTSGAVNKLTISLGQMAKVKAFQLITQEAQAALREMKAVDDELVTVRKVANATDAELKSLNDRAYQVGSQYGMKASDYLSAVADFTRAGYKGLAGDLGELAIKTQLVGDVSQSTATQMLLSVDTAYEYQGSIEKLSAVLDGMNEIDNNFATSIEKISEGLGKVAPIAAQAHVGVDELSAAIGTITAVTQRSGEEAATALRALFLNIIGDTKTEIADGATWTAGEIEGLRDVLRKYAPEAVKAAEATGQVINPMEAIAGLAQAMQEGVLNEQELMSMVSDIGGKLRTSQLLAIIQNWDMYQNMLQSFGDAAGSADKEISNAMDSWTRKSEILHNSVTKLMSNLVETQSIKQGLDGLIDVVNALDTSVGRTVITMGAAFTVTAAIVKLLPKLRSLKNLFAGTGVAGIAGAMAAGVSLMVTLYNNWKEAQEQALSGAAQNAQSAIDKQTELNILIQEYKELAGDSGIGTDVNKQEQARAIQEQIVSLVGDQAEGLDLVNGALEKQLGILQNISNAYAGRTLNDVKASAIEAEKAVVNLLNNRFSTIARDVAYRQDVADIFSKYSYLNYFGGGSDGTDGSLNFREIKNLSEATVAIQQLTAARDELMANGMATGRMAAFFSSVNQALSQYSEQLTMASGSLQNYYEAWIQFRAGSMEGGLTAENISAAAWAIRVETNATKEQADILDKATASVKKNTQAKEENAEAADPDKQKDEIDDLADATDKFTKALKDAEDAADALDKKLKDMGESGDAFRTLRDKYDRAVELAQEGKTGTNEFAGIADLLLGDKKRKALGDDGRAVGEFLQSEVVKGFREASEQGGGELAEYIMKNQFAGTEKAFTDLGDQIAIDLSKIDWNAFSDSTGLSVQYLQSMLGYIDEYDQKMQDVSANDGIEVDDSGFKNAKASADEYTESINNIPRSVTTTVTFKVNGSVPTIGGNVPNNRYNAALATGTSDAEAGPTLVNELGPELIAQNGRAFIAGGGKPTITRLEKGAIVYNHLETEALLNGGGLPEGGIGSRAKGQRPTAIDDTTGKSYTRPGPGIVVKKNSGGGNSNNKNSGGGSGKASKDDDTDWWRIVEDYYERAVDEANRAIDRLDYRLGLLQDEWDDLQEPLDKEIDALDRVNDQLDRQATLLERERDKQTKPLNDQIDAMQKAKDLQDEQLELAEKQKAVEEARNELQNAQNERTIRYFNTQKGQWEWMADKGRVQDAQDALADAEKDLADYEYDLQIKALERQVESIEDDYQAKIDELEAQQTANEDRIYDLEQQLQALEDYYKAAMEPMEKQQKELERKLAAIEEQWAEAEMPYTKPEGNLSNALNNIGGSGAENSAVRDVLNAAQGNAGTSLSATAAQEMTAPFTLEAAKAIQEAMYREYGILFGAAGSAGGSATAAAAQNNVVNNSGTTLIINGMTISGDLKTMTIGDLISDLSIYAGQ